MIVAVFSFSSCIKNAPKLLEDTVIEFDATVLNTPATGRTYAILTRVPTYGAAVAAANQTITRGSGTIRFRVNIVGPQTSADRTFTYKVADVATNTAPTSTLLAEAGTHYTTPGSFIIAANSSFGEVVINIVNPGTANATPRVLILELVGNPEVPASVNYKFLGIQISQS